MGGQYHLLEWEKQVRTLAHFGLGPALEARKHVDTASG